MFSFFLSVRRGSWYDHVKTDAGKRKTKYASNPVLLLQENERGEAMHLPIHCIHISKASKLPG